MWRVLCTKRSCLPSLLPLPRETHRCLQKQRPPPASSGKKKPPPAAAAKRKRAGSESEDESDSYGSEFTEAPKRAAKKPAPARKRPASAPAKKTTKDVAFFDGGLDSSDDDVPLMQRAKAGK